MDWGPWVVTFIAGQATGLGMALAISWVERRWRRQEVRAAEKRARLEERFERVRTYAIGLQEFVEAWVGVVRVWQERAVVDDQARSAQHMRRQLETQWERVVAVEPPPWALVFVRDMDAQKWLLQLRLVAQQCRDRCLGCIGSGEVMGEEEAEDFAEIVGEKLAKILEWMEQAVEEVEG